MWKPRSKLVDSDGNAKHATSLLQLRRIGAKRWNRRFVFLDHHLFCYGKEKGRKDKQVPFELIETVRREAAEKLRREHAPKEFVHFGWYLAVKGRTLLFCAETEESAEQWVGYLATLLRAMKGSPTGPLPSMALRSAAAAAAVEPPGTTPQEQILTRGATLAELGARYDEAHPNDESHYDTLTTAISPEELLTDETTRTTPAAASSAPQLSALTTPLVEQHAAPPGAKTYKKENAETALSTAPPAQVNQGDNSNDDSGSATCSSDTSLLDVSSDDTEGEDSGNDEDDGEDDQRHSRTQTASPPLSRSATAADDEALQQQQQGEHNEAERRLPREVRYARFLLPLAAAPHSHIGYRVPALELFFKSGDDVGSVTFSRTMEKVGKRDNAQTREVVLTTRHLYLFGKGGLANSQQVRCIDTHDITGVVESTTDKALVAILIPTFHDVLLKVVPQNSCVPGTPAEVKQQLIAHLYKAHCDVHTDHRFLFRESATVAKEIRRTVETKYPPLTVRAGDQMRVGEKAALLETFARNADEAVYWSSMVRQVQADRKPRLYALVVTESSLYSLSDTLQEVVRRTFIRDLLRAEYDRDAQSVLLQCRGVDMLFNMQSSAEFDDFLRVLPVAVADGFGRTLRLTPSKQLYSHAKLFSLSTLSGEGRASAARSTVRRHRGFLWPRGKKAAGGTKLLSSFAAAADAENDDGDGATAQAFHRSLQGDYCSSQVIRLFCAQFRFVEEVLQDYDDAVTLWRQYEASAGLPCWDTLRLRPTFTTRMRVGDICLSAACRLLDAKECATLAKSSALDLHASVVRDMGAPRAICVTSEGFLLLRNGVASCATGASFLGWNTGSGDAAAATTVRSKVKSRLSVAVSHIGSGGGGGNGGGGSGTGKDDEMVLGLVGWSCIAAVVRCHSSEGSSVALLTNRTHPVDYLFHLESSQAMLDVMAAAMGCYARFRQGDEDHMHLLPLYAAPRVQNLAVALKKTIFDPFPTVALRYTPHSFPSDRLRMAFVPDVADACRRFGDNTIYFSGLAWRVRSATLRKYSGHLEVDPGADMQRQNNHLYKSYIFVLTNVAIYHCTKGGFEVVRRTLLTDIKGITVGLHDPDTVLLAVPSEYDMYFRVEGRGAEVVARLQEAYVEWTNYGHYLPWERQGCHALEDYGLPVRQAPCVAALGTLTKPAYFNDLQSSRPAAECRRHTQQWHLRCLRRAIALFERAQIVARKERRPSPSLSPSTVTGGGHASSSKSAQQWSTWSRVQAALAERQSFLYFVQRRCFRFGLTSEDFDEMQRAQRLLRGYREMEASATALIAAASGTDLQLFQAALRRASAVPDLRLLVEEERRVHEGHLARRACLAAVFSAVRDYRWQPDGKVGTSFVALEATLLNLLQEAHHVGFDAAFLSYLVHVMRVLVQRTQLQRIVCDPASQTRLATMLDGGWVLVQQAAGEVGMTWTPPARASTRRRSPAALLQLNLRVALLALQRSALVGEPALVEGAVALAVSVLEACEKARTQGTAAVTADTTHAAKERDAAVAALRRTLDAAQKAHTPAVEEERQHLMRAVEALIAARQTHQRQQTWTPAIVKDLLATCVNLEEQAATQPALLLPHSNTHAVLAMEHEMLTQQQHRLQLRQALEKKELRARRQHAHELRQRRLATQRAAAHQQRRETTVQERRQRKALMLWSSQVDQLVSKFDAVLANAVAETDESIRLGIKRCVHLQRWFAEAGARYGLSAPSSLVTTAQCVASPTSSSAAARRSPTGSAVPPVNGNTVLATLLAKLQAVAARAQHLLDVRARCGADPYGRTRVDGQRSATATCSTLIDGPCSAATLAATGGDGEAATVAPELPPEVEQFIATLNAAGLVDYIQRHHDHPAMPAMLEQIQRRWQAARRRRRWVEALHRRVHAAAVLHSRELLEAALRQAEAAQYTDAAVATARRAVAAMTAFARRVELTSPAGSPPNYVDPWQRKPVATTEVLEPNAGNGEAEEKSDDDAAAAALTPPVLRATEEEAPMEAARVTDDVDKENTEEVEEEAKAKGSVERRSDTAGHDAAIPPQLGEVLQAMEGVAQAAEDVVGVAPGAAAVLRQLYAATVALVDSAASSATSARAEDEPSRCCPPPAEDAGRHLMDATAAVVITEDNPFCASFLQAWRAVLQHRLRPSGFLVKTPRTVWDFVRSVGDDNTEGNYTAPYVARLSSDFQRLYRSNDDSEAGRQRTDAVLLALIFFSHRMSCVWDGVAQLGAGGRRELLLPDSLMAQPAVVPALLAAARVCDGLRWRFANVQALAMACLFPRDASVEVPVPARLSQTSTVPEMSEVAAVAGSTNSSQKGQQKQHAPRQGASPSFSSLNVRTLSSAVEQTSPRVEADAASVAALRNKCAADALRGLQEAVRDIASYFTRQLRTHDPVSDNSQTFAAFFEERMYPELGTLVENAVLPSLLALLSCGLVRRFQLVRTRSLWDVLTALREALSTNSRTLAAAEVLPIMDLVAALTDPSNARGSNNAKLRVLSQEQLDELRVRVFLRECMNRRQLYPFVRALFPPPNGHEAWVGDKTGVLWTLYDPELCLLYPPDAASSVLLRPLLEKLSALPFVLIPDRELR